MIGHRDRLHATPRAIPAVCELQRGDVRVLELAVRVPLEPAIRDKQRRAVAVSVGEHHLWPRRFKDPCNLLVAVVRRPPYGVVPIPVLRPH
eukprot:6145796-Prymnesium_polylepis.2